jgi:hypothetical protein
MVRASLIISAISLILIFLLELTARLIFPEFKGHIHSSQTTLGQRFFMSKSFPIRIPSIDHTLKFERPLVIVLGDSISHGYGMAYEDIYWVRLQERLNLRLGDQAPEIVSLSYGGNNLNDSQIAIKNFLAMTPSAVISNIIYQFNFNDIVPEAYGRSSLQANSRQDNAGDVHQQSQREVHTINNSSSVTSQVLKTLTSWRYKYLNHSVLFRVTQHYAGQLKRKTTGTCEERGIDALGPYTWAFGSTNYLSESNALWESFSSALADLKKVSDASKARLSVLISPLVFDIDRDGKHPYFNHLNYDFSCAKINPTKRLEAIARELDIPVYDPTEYMRASFIGRIKEGNFTPFFFTADENHITPVAATLMSEYLEAQLGR